MKIVDIYEEIVRLRKEGGRAALATIVRRTGSTPRKDSAKMLIRADGSSVGSVGGGCVEAEVWQMASGVIETGKSVLVDYHLTEENAEKEGLVCGGTVEIFIEPIMGDPKLIILGAGHLGQAVAELAKPVGFNVIVADDRESFLSRERFPSADELVVTPFTEVFQRVAADANTYVLIVTRGHKHDQSATESAIRTGARYIGLVGSRRKIKIIVESLLQKGHSASSFEHVYAPIGIDIGSETPEEIAVSVVAELIAVRKGVHQRSPKQQYLSKLLNSP